MNFEQSKELAEVAIDVAKEEILGKEISVGDGSLAWGEGARATNDCNIAIGKWSSNGGFGSVVVGFRAKADSSHSVVLGVNSKVGNGWVKDDGAHWGQNVAINSDVRDWSVGNVAIGTFGGRAGGVGSSSWENVAIGWQATVGTNSTKCVALGSCAYVGDNLIEAVQIGPGYNEKSWTVKVRDIDLTALAAKVKELEKRVEALESDLAARNAKIAELEKEKEEKDLQARDFNEVLSLKDLLQSSSIDSK